MSRNAMNGRQTQDFKVKFLQLNMGKRGKADHQLQTRIRDEMISVALLQEPFHGDDNISTKTGHKFIGMGKTPKAAIVVSDPSIDVINTTHTDEYLAVARVVITGTPLVLASVYCKGRAANRYDPIEPDLAKLQKVLDEANARQEPMIIAGDFNAKSIAWRAKQTTARGEELANWICKNDLHILNMEGTDTWSLSPATPGSVIDLALVNRRALAYVSEATVEVENISCSDHRYISFDYTSEPNSIVNTCFPKYDVSRADWDLYRELLRPSVDRLIRRPQNSSADTEELAVKTIEAITTAANASIPKKRQTSDRRFRLSPELLRMKRRMKSMWKRYLRAKEEKDVKKTQAEAATNRYKTALDKERTESFRRFVTETADKNVFDVKRIVESRTRPDWTNTLSTICKDDDTFTNDINETLEHLTTKFFPDSSSELTGEDLEIIELCKQPPNTPNDVPVSEHETRRVIRKMQNRKAPGEDLIITEMVKRAQDILVPLLTKLANSCLTFGYFPHALKTALVRYLKKPGAGPDSRHKAFRPICLLSVIAKIIEAIIAERLQWHVHSKGLINDRQFGFVPNRSTTDAIINVRDYIRSGRASSRKMIAVFVDVQSAFDSIRWHHIMSALKKMDVPKNIYSVVNSYLSHRYVKAQVGNVEVVRRQTQGVPQGSSIGPILWTIVYDWVVSADVGEYCHVTAYADDIIVIGSAGNSATIDVAEERVTDALQSLTERADNIGIIFNPAKSKVMRLNVPRRPRQTRGILMKGIPIPEVNKKDIIKYLGVDFDHNQMFHKHIDNICDKAVAKLNQYRKLAQRNWGIGAKSMLIIYKAIIEPILFYATPALYDRMETVDWQRAMTGVQRLAMMTITKAYKTTSNEALFALTGIKPINIKVNEIMTNFYARKGEVKHPSLLLLPQDTVLNARKPKKYSLRRHPSIDPTTLTIEQRYDGSGDTLALIKQKTREAALEAHQRRWQRNLNGWHTYLLCHDIRKPTIGYSDFGHLRTQFLTGHGNFGTYLHRFNIKSSPMCETCRAEDSVEHVVYDCQRFISERQEAGIEESDRPLWELFASKEQKKKLFAYIELISEEWYSNGYREYRQRRLNPDWRQINQQ